MATTLTVTQPIYFGSDGAHVVLKLTVLDMRIAMPAGYPPPGHGYAEIGLYFYPDDMDYVVIPGTSVRLERVDISLGDSAAIALESSGAETVQLVDCNIDCADGIGMAYQVLAQAFSRFELGGCQFAAAFDPGISPVNGYLNVEEPTDPAAVLVAKNCHFENVGFWFSDNPTDGPTLEINGCEFTRGLIAAGVLPDRPNVISGNTGAGMEVTPAGMTAQDVQVVVS